MKIINMDALPLVLNRTQINLMQEKIHQAIDELNQQRQAGNFSSDHAEQNERNLLTYGTQEYEEAYQRLENIEHQLRSQLEGWNNAPDATKPVAIDLDSYQIKLLRNSLQQGLKSANGSSQAIEAILEQLPEASPQEDAD